MEVNPQATACCPAGRLWCRPASLPTLDSSAICKAAAGLLTKHLSSNPLLCGAKPICFQTGCISTQGRVLAAAGRAQREALGPCWAHKPPIGCLSAALSLGPHAQASISATPGPLSPPPLGAALSSPGQSSSGSWSSLGLLWPMLAGPCTGASPPGLRARSAPQRPGDCAPELPAAAVHGHRGLQPMRETGGLAPRAPRKTRRNCEVPAPRQPPRHCQRPLLTLVPLCALFSSETRIQHGADACQRGDRPASESRLLPRGQLKSFRVRTSAWSTPGAQGACD